MVNYVIFLNFHKIFYLSTHFSLYLNRILCLTFLFSAVTLTLSASCHV